MKKERNKAGEKLAATQPATEKANLKNSKKAGESQVKGVFEKGFVKLYRSCQDGLLWNQKKTLSQWGASIDLYLNAWGIDNPRFEFEHRIVDLKRGQLITSQRKLAKRWNWSRGSVRNFLDKLQKQRLITAVPSSLGRSYLIITFLKYNELNPVIKNKHEDKDDR